jgi:precorrin-4/cobalt-precorrin-4 C11-methyltransferase
MTVHFIGAGPGAPDLITVRGQNLVASSPVCLYAGSLVPREIVALAPTDARVVDTAPMHLDEIEAEFVRAHEQGLDVARLHSGDLSVWSAMGEQLRRLRARGIPYTITPGVPAFAASAAALGVELTLPEVAQSVVLTRTSGRASAMPGGETLEHFAASRATLAVHLSVHVLASVAARLTPYYGGDCAVAVVYRASWPDERVIRGTLENIAARVKEHAIDSTATILVGPALSREDFRESALYSIDYQRRYRGRDSAPAEHRGRDSAQEEHRGRDSAQEEHRGRDGAQEG